METVVRRGGGGQGHEWPQRVDDGFTGTASPLDHWVDGLQGSWIYSGSTGGGAEVRKPWAKDFSKWGRDLVEWINSRNIDSSIIIAPPPKFKKHGSTSNLVPYCVRLESLPSCSRHLPVLIYEWGIIIMLFSYSQWTVVWKLMARGKRAVKVRRP